MEDFLLIALNGLPAGKTEIGGRLRKKFFVDYGNTEILDADVSVAVEAEKSGAYLGLDLKLKGEVTVACDRCLEELVLPVDRTVLLEVKTGTEDSQNQQEGEREVLCLPQDCAELDLSQTVYDYVCLSLPIQRHHGEGECNPDAIKYLCDVGGESRPSPSVQSPSDSPFAALAGLFDDK